MDDIEDLQAEVGDFGPRSDARRSLIFPKKYSGGSVHHNHTADVDSLMSNVPGTQKVWLKTFGCSHNVSDSEYMEGLLQSYGFRMVPNQDDADVWVINSCTVKDPSQSAFMHLVTKSRQSDKRLVVAGCVPQADRSLVGLEDVSVVGVQQIDRVVEAVEETLKGNTVRMLGKKTLPRLDLPKVRKNPLVEIIPLSTGCLGACTYCKTKHARGKLGSYALEAIVDRARSVIREGVSEIWLSSEDTGAYGRDIGTSIVELLRALVAVLPADGSVMLRVGMTNPPYILEHLDAIAEILNSPLVYAFLHVPVQAGSNSVLTAMNREYTVEEFRRVADHLLTNVPGMTLATDIICGFPNETEEDFEETMQLMAHYRLAIVNISQFYPRPGTPAAKMKRIATNIVKNRSRRLTQLFESTRPYDHLITSEAEGRNTVRVWFDTEISNDGKHSVGHTRSYIKVLVPLDDNLPGTSYMVELHSAARFHVVGVVKGARLATCLDNIAPGEAGNKLGSLRKATGAAAGNSSSVASAVTGGCTDCGCGEEEAAGAGAGSCGDSSAGACSSSSCAVGAAPAPSAPTPDTRGAAVAVTAAASPSTAALSAGLQFLGQHWRQFAIPACMLTLAILAGKFRGSGTSKLLR